VPRVLNQQCRVHRVFKDLKEQLAHRARKDLRAYKALLDHKDHRVFKDHREMLGRRGLKVLLVLKDRKVRKVFREAKAHKALAYLPAVPRVKPLSRTPVPTTTQVGRRSCR
jgi:predicted site-specific integrase-resolvase